MGQARPTFGRQNIPSCTSVGVALCRNPRQRCACPFMSVHVRQFYDRASTVHGFGLPLSSLR
ncbi:unnamed protein product, partial [Nesidiocoris tenuis]